MHDHLKPCPFCSRKEREFDHPLDACLDESLEPAVFVRCRVCGAIGPMGRDTVEAAALWNQRYST